MDKLFSTDDVHPRDRFDYWHQVACANIVGHDSHAQRASSFSASLEAGSVGDVSIIRCSIAPITFQRTARHFAAAPSDKILLCMPLGGQLNYEQGSRSCRLKAGGLAMIDPMLPLDGEYCGDANVVIVALPRSDLEARLGEVRELMAQDLSPGGSDGAYLASYLSMLTDHAGQLSQAAADRAQGHLLDLTAMALSQRLSRRVRLSNPRAIVRFKIRGIIEAHLEEPTLDVRMVAERAGVGLRYANSVLADEHTSVSRLILERRLERCRAALVDPAQAGRSISDIAFGWGFSDLSHFGRKFRSAFGSSAKDYRNGRA